MFSETSTEYKTCFTTVVITHDGVENVPNKEVKLCYF